jgi:Mg2+/Co2+ transporter CorB
VTGIWATLGVVVLLLALSGFFSSSETALTAASRARMHQLSREGNARAERVSSLIEQRERLIGAILLGNNFVNTLISALTTALLVTVFGNEGLVIVAATAIVTVLVLIFGEVLPKTYAIANPDKLALQISPALSFLVALLAPLTATVQWIVRGALALAGVRVDPEVDVLAAREEIRGAVELHAEEGSVEREARDRLRGALDLGDLTVADVMVHRKNMRMIDADLPVREIVALSAASTHTRLPLWRDDPENIIGVLHARDVLRAVADFGIDQLDPSRVARAPWFVPESTNAEDQLAEFLRRREHFAFVVDEYGALRGLVTLEDILEEIVGDIRDEHDIAVQGVRPQPDGSVFVDGWVPIRDLNRVMDWDLPDEEAVTVAGLVIHESQSIPEPGQLFSFHGYRFLILRRARNQITALRLQREPEEELSGG